MKIRCDVCDKVEASVFCSADEAALCEGCDSRVHHANKLASKHLRFPLLHPSLKESPLCDICQERRAILFCQEDRAILCRECDIPIHKANEHTQKHNRFLLTGVKLSVSSSSYHSSPCNSSSEANIYSTTDCNKSSHPALLKKQVLSNEIFSSPVETDSSQSGNYNADDNHYSDNGSISTSSISEYLETVPGWRVDEFLDPFFANNHGLSKTNFDHVLTLVDQDFESNINFWVPQVLPHSHQLDLFLPQTGLFDGFEDSKAGKHLKEYSSKKWSGHDWCFTVPQISPPSCKKSRH